MAPPVALSVTVVTGVALRVAPKVMPPLVVVAPCVARLCMLFRGVAPLT